MEIKLFVQTVTRYKELQKIDSHSENVTLLVLIFKSVSHKKIKMHRNDTEIR